MKRFLVGTAVALGMMVGTESIRSQAVYAAGEPVRGQTNTSPRLVTLELKNATITEAVQAIARQTGVPVAVGDDVLASSRRVNVTLHREALRPAIEKVLIGTAFRLQTTTSGAFFVNGNAEQKTSEDAVITGRVVHEKTKQPIVGARISVGGDGLVVETGSDGTFRVSVKAGSQTLSVRALGFVRWSKTVVAEEGKTVTVPVELVPSASVLDEVVVTGTVIATERKAIPTPITVIHGEELERRGITRIEQLFRGEIPGLLVLEQGTETYSDANVGRGVSSQVYSRGSADLRGGANPIKTYVDGVELLDPSYLGTIDPSSIERIEVVTGPQAATIYGSGAMGGVMQIFTKKGKQGGTPELNLSVKYGMLQNSFSDGKAPQHLDVLSMNGGIGPELSYSANLSYNYSGQWQPKLYNRRYGASLGATHTRGRLTASGSYSISATKRGTWGNQWSSNFGLPSMIESGDAITSLTAHHLVGFSSNRVSTSSSQVASFDATFRLTPKWQHQVGFGRSQNAMALEPLAPNYATWGPVSGSIGSDSLFKVRRSVGNRVTWGYNTSYVSAFNILTSSLTLGMNGSSGESVMIDGCQATAKSSTIIDCTSNARFNVTVPLNEKAWGSFTSWQLGLWGKLYATFGLRAEQNPNYGSKVKFDITPTNGLTYTIERGDMILKLMGSYGQATRPPSSDWRLEVISNSTTFVPSQYVLQFANPELRPQYSRGPQAGVELYYGNLGSLSINHYQQVVTDLIQRLIVDSFTRTVLSTGNQQRTYQYQYLNVAKMRQIGWEGTGSGNVGPVTVKTTYSWNDSRVLVDRLGGATGQSFVGLPTHTGNFNISYAHARTSFTLVTNWIGATIGDNYKDRLYSLIRYHRHNMYNLHSWIQEFGVPPRIPRTEVGYLKSDFSSTHRISPQLAFTLHIVNIGNSFTSDVGEMNPALGRQTTLGFSYRFGKN